MCDILSVYKKKRQIIWLVREFYINLWAVYRDTMIGTLNKTRVIGVDICLDVTTLAIIDLRGNILAKSSIPTYKYPEINGFVTALSEAILTISEQNGGYESIRSVGVSSPSANFRTGAIENPPNLPWKGRIPLAAMLRDRLGLAVALANNAYATGMGEYVFGSAHGMKSFLIVTLGLGMGSCLFINGRAYRGANGFAGEIGHTCYKPGGRLCGCGKRGCLETYTADKGILMTAAEVMAETDIYSPMRQDEKLTLDRVISLCNEGDELAVETMRRTGRILGVGLANYASIVNPEAIIFAGPIVQAGDRLIEPAKQAFDEHVFHNIAGKVKFLVPTLDEKERDVLGASALAWLVKEYSLFTD